MILVTVPDISNFAAHGQLQDEPIGDPVCAAYYGRSRPQRVWCASSVKAPTVFIGYPSWTRH